MSDADRKMRTTTETGLRRIRMLVGLVGTAALLIAGSFVLYGYVLGWDAMGWLVAAMVYAALAAGGVAAWSFVLGGHLWDAVTESHPDIPECLAITVGLVACVAFVIVALGVSIAIALPASVYRVGDEWVVPVAAVGFIADACLLGYVVT